MEEDDVFVALQQVRRADEVCGEAWLMVREAGEAMARLDTLHPDPASSVAAEALVQALDRAGKIVELVNGMYTNLALRMLLREL